MAGIYASLQIGKTTLFCQGKEGESELEVLYRYAEPHGLAGEVISEYLLRTFGKNASHPQQALLETLFAWDLLDRKKG